MKQEYKKIKSVTGTMILAEADNMPRKEKEKLFIEKIKQLRKNKNERNN